MSLRDRAALRKFLHLDARAGATVRPRDIERQEDTVLRALACLDEQPGVVLADEVGMGKTYEALGVLAARLEERPAGRSLILTPGPDLNKKWMKELRAFGDPTRQMYAGFAGKFAAADDLAELVQRLRAHQLVVAPVTVFLGGRGEHTARYLLSLWGELAAELAGNQLAALFRRYRGGELERVELASNLFLDAIPWATVQPLAKRVLREHKDHCKGSLHQLWKAGEYEAFADKSAVDQALTDLRFRLIGHLLPALDLLVIDEAHKLKSTDSVRAMGVRTAFAGRFEHALFLTATPFQLEVSELRQVFALFGLARTAPPQLGAQVDQLLADVKQYTAAYAQLERVWAQADDVLAAEFAAWFAGDPQLLGEPDAALLPIVVAARQLLALKRERIEPGFRKWMIRSLREDKRVYRRVERKRLQPQLGAAVPFLLYERFIAELFRSGNQTHKAAVQINLVSSYGAAREGALLSNQGERFEGDAEAYRRLLQSVVGRLREETSGHPKVDHVVRDTLAAVGRGEKTLIFCTRLQTLHELKRQIEGEWTQQLLERWRRAYPGAGLDDIFEHKADGKDVSGHHSRLRDRFGSSYDALYLALRERYGSTLLGGWMPAPEQQGPLLERANALLGQQRVSKLQAERFDWALAKRCLEQASASMMRELGLDQDVDEVALAHLTDPRFVAMGYDLVEDDVESSTKGQVTPRWRIEAEHLEPILRRDHLWAYLTGALHALPPELRVRTVERLASYLVRRNVPFLADLMAFARAEGLEPERVEARALLQLVDRFWLSAGGRPWRDLLHRFLVYLATLDEALRREVLDDILPSADLVRHTVDGESRERLREAFNTPLFPMVLVANEVMQEGLDLHHHCRRVIHHDLPWNPAQLEQRVGRVDRLGSLVQRLRERKSEVTLDVLLPLIANTIDERLERTVRLRERWLEFLLGAAPRLDEYALDEDPPLPLPAAFAEALRIELGPTAPSALATPTAPLSR